MCMWLPGKGPPVCAVSGSQAHLLKPLLPIQVMALSIIFYTFARKKRIKCAYLCNLYLKKHKTCVVPGSDILSCPGNEDHSLKTLWVVLSNVFNLLLNVFKKGEDL